MVYWPLALSVTAHFAFWYVIVPGVFLPQGVPALDRRPLGIMLMAAGAIVTGYLLALLRLYEPVTVWLILAGAIAFAAGKGRKITRLWFALLNAVDECGNNMFRHSFRAARSRLGEWWQNRPRQNPMQWALMLLTLIVVGWAAWLRFYPYLYHAYFGASDAYVHLAWTKYLERHNLFRDGIYPYGYHAILAVLATFSALDLHQILRFIGPLGGTLLVLSVGYAARKLGLRPAAAVVAMAIIGLGFGSPLPADAFRQSQPLPQEFAAAFVLPGAAAAWQYLRAGKSADLLLAILAVFLTAAIHTYAFLGLAVPIVVITVCGVLCAAVPWPRVWYLAGGSAGVVLLAFMPLGIAAAKGMPWHASSTVYIAEQVRTTVAAPGLQRLYSGNIGLDSGAAASLCLIGWAIIDLWRGNRERGPLLLALGIISGLLFTQVYTSTGIPVVMDSIRSGLFFSLFACIAVTLLFDLFLGIARGRKWLEGLLAAITVVLFIHIWWPHPGTWMQYEYDDAANMYVQVRAKFTLGAWTIVAPTEQYSQTLGSGWHEELGQFLLRMAAEDVRRPRFQLYIPTPDVFVFVEKQPLGTTGLVKPDPDAPVPLAALSEPKELENLYRNPATRALLMQRVWGLMETYRLAHPDQVQIYYDRPHFRVYHVQTGYGAEPITALAAPNRSSP